MLSPIQMFVAERPALAAPTACQPNEPNDENWQPGVSGEPQRCINGYKYTTRRRLKNVDGCLKSRPDALSHVYRHNKCGQGIEYIGQARAIRYLSDQLEPGLAGVTPDVQWEMQVGRDRLDILYYDRTMPAPNAAVQVIEAKVTTNNDYAQWPGQVDGYIDYLRNNGMTSVARGQILNYWGPYVDLFRVEDNKSKCESADGQPITNAASVIRTYRATSPEPGLLRIEEIEDLAECAEHPDPPQTLPRPGNQTEEPKPSWLERLREWFRLHRPSKVYGEPHLVTVDRLHYELQSVGEFLLADSDRYDMQIQARFTERRENVSIIDRTAMYVNEHVVELGNYQLRIDGELVSLASGDAVDLGAQAAVLRSGGSYYVLWDGPDGPMFQWDGACCHASLKMPRTSDSDLVGLLGNADGDPKNDLRLRDGTQLPVNASPAVLHESYADSWRVSNNESLFTYAPGQSTDTFTDLSFPQKIVNIHDLTPEQRSAGAAYCEEQQVPPGPQFNACVLDIALTSDESFAEMAAQQQEIVLDPQAATVDANGSLSVDFETSPLPENLLPTRVSSDPATSTFAGSFSGSGSYRFFVQSLPPHMNGTLAFDLITLGDWNSDDDTETVTVETDRGDPYVITPSELTPASSGTLASGVPFSVYRVQVPFEHAKSQIEFTFSGTGVDGVSGQGFGIDDIQLSMQVVPPQSFEATLPLSVSDGVPAAGAGNLETSISEDAYQFEVAQGGSIYIDIRSCAGGGNNLLWELRNAAGAKVASKGCEDGEVRGLAAGTYRLVVKPERESTGAYSLRVSTIPADVSATVTTDGQPSTLTVGDPGQNGTWTFTGTAGQRLYFGFSGGTFGSITQATVQVLKPDGKALSEARWCGRSCSFDTTALPVSGTYTIVLNPENTHTGALTARVNEVPADVSATVTTDGQPSTLTVGDPGQNGTWTFTGTAGQRLYFGFSGGTFGSITQATVQVLKPDGKALYGAAYCGTSCAFNTTILPVGGTYTIRLNPKDGHTGSLTAKVTDVPEDASDDTITIGGPASTLTTTSPGQNGTWLFTGTTGQRVYFNFTGGTYGNINYATVQVKSPDGSTLLDSKACGNHCAFNTTTLPLDGTYTIVLNPKDNYTGSLTARLYEVPGDISTTVTIGGPASTLTTTAPGQNGTWTFTG
ncbi:VWD domain-containing protein, partial [Thermomonospora echinospora]